MLQLDFYRIVCVTWLVLGLATVVALRFVTAPYGRFTRKGWGPLIDRRIGWIVMEFPAVFTMAWFFGISDRTSSLVPTIFLVLWELHYVYRTFLFPFRMRGSSKGMTLLPVVLAVVFNLGNGYLNGAWLFHLGPTQTVSWLSDPRFLCGLALFFFGMSTHIHADAHLRSLRTPGDSAYKIPTAFMFRHVSCANYFGELVEWAGWALLTWSPGGLVFFLWTAANLVPRALSHHAFYKERFAQYPQERKAVIPFLL